MGRKIQEIIDKIFHRRRGGLNFRRSRKKLDTKKIKWVVVFVLETTIVIGLAALMVNFFGTQIKNANASMEPTYKTGDVLLVNTLVYKYKSPAANDVIVFKPRSNSTSGYSIKRVIGVPGDTVEIKKGRVYVNGEVFSDEVKTESVNDGGRAKSQIVIGDDEYFVLGDNRNLSEDSRYETIGNIQKDDIMGKVWMLYPF